MVSLAQANSIIDGGLAFAREKGYPSVTVCVLDTGGHVVCLKREDGAAFNRENIARAKAYGALGWGFDSRTIMDMAVTRPVFITTVATVTPGGLISSPGGVLIRDPKTDQVIGAVGVSGHHPDTDEAIAVNGIEGNGFKCSSVASDIAKKTAQAKL
eukprot:c19256_g1_i1.p1 GENE.c19256_g1_i1~~c19256_g1_i1.p1  ORF type:complete len:165 (-),score=44.10 c19256_g1_i1:156-623(-)